MTKKLKKDPISAADYAITMLVDGSSPLVLSLQLFWFDPRIALFLDKELFYEASNGIRIGSLHDFTYTPFEVDSGESKAPYAGYLLGFGSNMHNECYNKTTVTFKSEEDKLRHKELITAAIHELVQAAISIESKSSPWFVWHIDKN